MRQASPAVSVIVPVYNVREFLPLCIATLKVQTIGSVEFLLIDDGSTDGSGEIAEELTRGDPRFTVYAKQNGGLSDARNFGLDRAKGDFVGFVDSDDWVDATMFQKLYDRAVSTQSDIVVCAGTKIIEATDEHIPIELRGGVEVFGTSVSERPEILYASHSLACNKLFSRHLFDSGKFRFPVGQWYEDSALIYNIMAMASRIDCVPEQLYYYRFQREGSITNSVSEKVFDIFLSCRSIVDFYRDHHLLHGNVPDVLEKVIRNHIIVRFDVVLDGPDKYLARRYVDAAFDFMNSLFPGWITRYPVQPRKRWSWKFHARRSRMIAKARIAVPTRLRKSTGKLFSRFRRLVKRMRALPREIQERRSTALKQKILREHGHIVLLKVGDALLSAGATYFADFGTLLGFVRDGQFMPHDVDLDIGVLSDETTDFSAIRRNLVAIGCSLWREYVLDGKIVEESYHFPVSGDRRLKFDINYYRSDADRSRTFLFYREPKQRYRPRERNIVEMNYSRIEGVTEIEINGHQIPIPLHAERLLEEKYGAGWRTPDSGWIYWRSPAATRLHRREFYRQPPPNAVPDHKLRDLQLEQLAVLDAVASLCEQHGLRYYLNEGTLLGAVRHQGFIPWDDDVDIAMPREDYDRLLAIPSEKWPSQARLWCYTTDPRYHLPFAKAVATTHSQFRNTFPPDIAPEFAGPRIDIFPLDRVPFESGPDQSAHWSRIRMIRDLLLLKRGYPLKQTWRNRRRKIAASALSYRTLHKWLYSESTRHNSNLRSIYVINNGSSYKPSRQKVPAAWYGEPKYLPYEGELRPCPAEPEKILSSIYGDYLTPPPEGKRTNSSHYMRYFPESDA